MDSVVDLTICPEEQILSCNQPDMDDCEVCENQDEDAVAMIEESHSGIWAISNKVYASNLLRFQTVKENQAKKLCNNFLRGV